MLSHGRGWYPGMTCNHWTEQMRGLKKIASVLISCFRVPWLQHKHKTRFSKNDYCRTIPGITLCISKPVMPIKRKKILSRKIVSNPWACHKLSYLSFKAALLHSYSHTLTAQLLGQQCHPHSASISSSNTVTFMMQTGGVAAYSQDQRDLKENSG